MQTVFANDMADECREFYEANFPGGHFYQGQLQCVPDDAIPAADIITASPPCQSFSRGSRNPKKMEDDRVGVMDDILLVAMLRQPRWLVWENARGMLANDVWPILEERTKAFLPSYKCKRAVFETSKHTGIPQNRARAFVVWFRESADHKRFKFPQPRPEMRLVSDFLEDEQDVPADLYYPNRPGKHGGQLPLKMHRDMTKPVRTTQVVYHRVSDTNELRENKTRRVPCLMAGMGETSYDLPLVLDGRGPRPISPREAFRLQGWDDANTVLPPGMSRGKLYKLAGNGITLALGQLVLQALVDQRADTSLRSVLAYPGGKTRAVKQLRAIQLEHFPDARVLHSAFHGGCSFELDCASRGMRVVANDLSPHLSHFWREVQRDRRAVETVVLAEPRPPSRERWYQLRQTLLERPELLSTSERAAYYLLLNKYSYAGQTLSSGYSIQPGRAAGLPAGYLDRCGDLAQFTFSNEDALDWLRTVPQREDVLLFVDPPYVLKPGQHGLYGVRGDLHEGFDHNHTRLRDELQRHPRWMLCYNDCPLVRELYKEHVILEVRFKYGTRVVEGVAQTDANELVILSTKRS